MKKKKKPEETRSGRYGIHLALVIDYVISTLPEEQQQEYRSKLIEELKKYSSKKESRLEKEVMKTDNPVYVASVIKEGLNLMYQETTSNRTLDVLIYCLENPSRIGVEQAWGLAWKATGADGPPPPEVIDELLEEDEFSE